MEERLQSQKTEIKTKYEGKVKNITESIQAQYKAKIEEAIAKFTADIEAKDKKFKALRDEFEAVEKKNATLRDNSRKFEDRYNMAKNKLAEMANKLNETNHEYSVATAKQEGEMKECKRRIEKLEAVNRDLEMKANNEKFRYENIQLMQEVKNLKAETRSLKVQNDAADAKIRELQKSKNKSTGNLDDGVAFKMPSAVASKHTPGRTRASRTQSEVAMARRPPVGAGSLFQTDDEAGEMFTNSFLSDLKEGRCSLEPSDISRLSELSRRNTMQPAHLKSTYAAETHFSVQAKEFTDEDLRLGRIQVRKYSCARKLKYERTQLVGLFISYTIRSKSGLCPKPARAFLVLYVFISNEPYEVQYASV